MAVGSLCDTAHRIERERAETPVFDKGADSVDFALVTRVRPGDIITTQDYGLACMCTACHHENKKLLRPERSRHTHEGAG